MSQPGSPPTNPNKKAKTSTNLDLIVTSRVKAMVKQSEMQSKSEALEALADAVQLLIEASITNAKKDKRKTIRAADVPDVTGATALAMGEMPCADTAQTKFAIVCQDIAARAQERAVGNKRKAVNEFDL
jgi:histone H3/H4